LQIGDGIRVYSFRRLTDTDHYLMLVKVRRILGVNKPSTQMFDGEDLDSGS
jgi:hypothetical protein